MFTTHPTYRHRSAAAHALETEPQRSPDPVLTALIAYDAEPAGPPAEPAPLFAAAAIAPDAAPKRPAWIRATLLATASAAAPLTYFMSTGALAENPIGLGAIAALPPLLIYAGAALMHEFRRARARADEVADLARRAFTPDIADGAVRDFGRAVRGEIEAFEQVVERALVRLQDLERATTAHAGTFEGSIQALRSRAREAREDFNDEISAMDRLSVDMHMHAQALTESLSRQLRMIRDASSMTTEELAAAEKALAAQFDGLERMVAAFGERSHALENATGAAVTATGAFDGVVGRALDALSQATALTDASKQNVEAAAEAAQATAAAVRDVTKEAVADARRAAQIVRAEAEDAQIAAGAALARLAEVAAGARAAAEDAQAAADRHAGSIQRRLAALAETARPGSTAPAQAPAPAPQGEPASRRARLPMEVFDAAGVDLEGALSPVQLERIAQRAELGRAARRRAVKECAEDAVARLGAHLRAHPAARIKADQFRNDPGLAAPSADREGGPQLARAYLLIDAALG